MTWWIWVLIAFAVLAAELVTSSLHLGFFSVGALVVALLVGLGLDIPVWGQLLIFTAVSLIAFVWLRPILVKRMKLDRKIVVDSLVGELATTFEDIAPGANGRAELRGATWSARNVGETLLTRGQRCTVTAVEGLVLHVRA
ncbi:MAG TPA: NfeD family protein [Thermoanaerobaculia bacterium]|jgi:membrane protein implicated in regulation of membrane protease activity|nr:NfeD family protein [Thermoanaerobaculia bacterium]